MARGSALVLVALLTLSSLPLLAPPAEAAEAKLQKIALPMPMVGAAAAQVGSYVYLLGGRLADGSYSDQIIRYDPATGANVSVGQLPLVSGTPDSHARYAGAVATRGTKIYYFGGATTVQQPVGTTTARVPKPVYDIVVFDTATGSAVNLASQFGKTGQQIPGGGAWGMSVAVDGDIAYLFGGFTLDLSTYSFQRHDWILSFDMAAERISTLASKLPYPVQDAGSAIITSTPKRVYLFGGLADNNTANLCPGRYVQNETTGASEYKRPALCLTDQIIRWDPQVQDNADVVDAKLPYRVQFADAGTATTDRGTMAYVLGGLLVDGSPSQAILEFNPRSTTPIRTLTPRLDPGIFGSGVTLDGRTITLWGGRTGDANQLSAAIVKFDPNPTVPFPPVAARAARTATGIHVEWQPPTYDGDSPITGYNVYRTGPEGTEAPLSSAATQGLSVDDAAVKPGVNYTYRITALNSYGESPGVRVSTATSATVPGAVQHFTAYAGNGQVVLGWDAPLENGGADLTGYRVYCNCSSRPASLDANTFTYAWSGLANGAVYTFRVFAVNAKGEGAASPTLAASPAPVPDAPANVVAAPTGASAGSATGVTVSWQSPSTTVERFLVLRGTSPTVITQQVGNLTPTQTSFVDNAVDHGRTYYYAIVSVNTAGQSPPSAPVAVSLVDVPGAPTRVTAKGFEGLVQVSWDAPTNLGGAEPSAITYAVIRTSPSGSSKIVSPPDLKLTSFSDKSATPLVQYSYTVVTQNPRRSEASAPATAAALIVANRPPSASLTVLPAIATAGDPVTLDASQSADPDGSIVEYAFDFGDGSDVKRTNESAVSHSYATNGTYAAKVIVTDDRGNVSEAYTARVIVGTLVGNGGVDTGSGLPTPTTGRPATVVTGPGARPGAGTGKVPGFEAPLVALALVGAALVTLRLRRR